jgi:RNA polymerase I-specific transcription initiation factor RRN7
MKRQPVKGLRRGDEIKVTDEDVLGMSARKIDDYLYWYQRTWMDDRDPKGISPPAPPINFTSKLTTTVAEQILELFPVSEPPPRAIEDIKEKSGAQALKEVQQNLIFQTPKPVEENEGSGIRRPGEFYRKYRKVEDLSESAKVFYERAGKFLFLL